MMDNAINLARTARTFGLDSTETMNLLLEEGYHEFDAFEAVSLIWVTSTV